MTPFIRVLKDFEGKPNQSITVVLKGGVKTVSGSVQKIEDGIVVIQNGPSHARQKHMIDVGEVTMVSSAS